MNQLHFSQVRRQLMTDSNAIVTSHDLQFNVRRCWPYVLPNSSSRDPKAARPRRPENPWKAPRLSVRRWIRRRKNRQTVREAETSEVPRQVCLKNFSCYFLSQWILRLSLYNMLHENSLRKQLSQFVLAVFLAFNLLIADICRLLTFSHFFVSKHVDHRWIDICWWDLCSEPPRQQRSLQET